MYVRKKDNYRFLLLYIIIKYVRVQAGAVFFIYNFSFIFLILFLLLFNFILSCFNNASALFFLLYYIILFCYNFYIYFL